MRRLYLLLVILLLTTPASAGQMASTLPSFSPLENWRAAVLAGDSAALAALYTQSPLAQITGPGNRAVAVPDEVSFWSSLKKKGLMNLDVKIVQQEEVASDIHGLVLEITLTTEQGTTATKQYMAMRQSWFRQDGQWRLGQVSHTAVARLRQPMNDKQIYDPSVDATEEIAEAVKKASARRKRVLLVFGGNWCFDCHVLDAAFHSPEIAPALNKSFVVAHIDIGQMDKNLDVAKKYEIPLERGVPAIAVLDSNGQLLFSQKQGEFEAARSMAPGDILAFLNKWKPHST